MLNPLSPLSPAQTNRNAAPGTEWRREPSTPSKHSVNAGDENRPFDSPISPASSPLVADVTLPPSKNGSPSVSQPPAMSQSPAKRALQSHASRPLTENALREKEHSTQNTLNLNDANIDPSIRQSGGDENNSYVGMDDTCFSAFSAVPNTDMTRFANMGGSPTKSASRSPLKTQVGEATTPGSKERNTPSRRPNDEGEDQCSPTPRQRPMLYEEDTTNLLVDFTDQFSIAHSSRRSPNRPSRTSPLKSQSHNQLSSYASSRRTPSPTKYPLPPASPSESRHIANLLDFDLTPARTPRSIPSITARELESMKSNFLSQISSLTATLSGREAEVKALSNAVTDAERRVGEALEEVRDERNAKVALRDEKEDLEKRQQEMQKVLKDVKEEIIAGDREKDALLQRAQEADHKREEAETRAIEAEGKLEGMKDRSFPPAASHSGDGTTNSNAEVEAAVTKVAKELHGLYKSKHEAKVGALKKSYSDRWERKVRDLQSRIDELSKENDELRVGRDATMSGVVPGPLLNGTNDSEAVKADLEAQQQRLADQKQKLDNLEEELAVVQERLEAATAENDALRDQLSASRQEIEDLVTATEELMQLSVSVPASQPTSAYNNQAAASTSQEIKSSLNRSTSGSSGLKAPGFGGGSHSGESRIGRVGAGYGSSLQRDRSGSSGLGTRSGIMSNIERMGRGRAVD